MSREYQQIPVVVSSHNAISRNASYLMYSFIMIGIILPIHII